jgi:hypothetical protein
VGNWIEIEHHFLFEESECSVGARYDSVDVLICCLFHVDVFGLDSVNMPVNVEEAGHTFSEFQVGPPTLDTQGSSLLN